MGTYLNPGNANFAEMAATGRYVDKTMLIDLTNRRLSDPTFKFVCVSRPRRFGKSLAGDMLVAYYSRGADSKELFAPYKISGTADFGRNLNKFNVVYIDLNAMYSKWLSLEPQEKRPATAIGYATGCICREFRKQFPDVDFDLEGGDSVAGFIQQAYEQRQETFIIIIDEYDVFVREEVSKENSDVYLAFLNSLFKNASIKSAIPLAYLTGILPIMKDKVQSKLNTFRPYNMLYAGEFSEFVGFTSGEVAELCREYGRDYELCRSWYDGYRLRDFEVYNPEAVMEAVTTGEFRSYWSGTSTYEVVAQKIRMNFAGIRDDVVAMLAGEKIPVSVDMYDNTMSGLRCKDDVYTFLIHLGYLAYDEKSQECYIPNREIHEEWRKAVRNNPDYEVTNRIIRDSERLLSATLAGDGEAVALALDRSHGHVTSNLSYNNEQSLQSAIYLAYIYALNLYTVVREMTAGRGYADIVYIPFDKSRAALIVELKHNKSAGTALTQIKEKQYFQCLANWSGRILFVGVNYDESTKKHECRIEQFVKA